MESELGFAGQLPLIVGLVLGMVVGSILGFVIANGRQLVRFSEQRELARITQEQQQQQLQLQLATLRENNAVLSSQLQSRLAELENYQQASADSKQHANQLQMQIADQGALLAALNKELEQERKVSLEKIKELQDAKLQFTQEFELLANRIFDEKTDRFSKQSKSALDVALNPLREQISDFKKKVEDVYDKDSKERISLVAELAQLKQLNQQMSSDALNLTNALKGDNKAQGNWGEVILERVLEESGLHKGREYDTQVSLKTEDGLRRNPDVVVRLPENKDIIIDSKVSLVHYERFCNSNHEHERQQALKDHIASVRSHISGLSFKDYEKLEGIRTLDFVFIFIPIESAFMAAFEHDPAMFSDAYEKNIIVVGPTTLLATLRTVQSIWRYERQNKNAEEIARQAGAMHDKFVSFINDLEKISDYLSKATQAHENAMQKLASGKGNLINSTQRLEKLGAKVKKSLPLSMLEQQEWDDEESLLGLELRDELESKDIIE